MKMIYQLIKLQEIKFMSINNKRKNQNQIEMNSFNFSQEVCYKELIPERKQ